jgi:hypothetical protein
MNPKQYTTAILAVLIMAGIWALTGWPSFQEGMAQETGETAVAQLGPSRTMQIWRGELDDDATEEQVLAGAEKWFAAATSLKGGKNLEYYVNFPVVVNSTGETDLTLVIFAPTFKEWGQFWDGYGDSPAADIEAEHEAYLVCPDSTLWESFKVKTKAETPDTSKTAVAPVGMGKALQMWRCELVNDATEEQVMEMAQKWLAAARTLKGGKNLDLYVNFPVVVNATREIDMVLMLVAPSFEEWGEFWDGYGNSPAADVEDASHSVFVCPDSVLWETFKVKKPQMDAR